MLYIKLFIEREKNTGQSAPECPFKAWSPAFEPFTFSKKARCLHCAKCHNLMLPACISSCPNFVQNRCWLDVSEELNRKCTFDFRKYFFHYRTVNSWIVEAESLNTFKARLDNLGSPTSCLHHAVAVLTSRPMKRVKFTLRLGLHHTNSPALSYANMGSHIYNGLSGTPPLRIL